MMRRLNPYRKGAFDLDLSKSGLPGNIIEALVEAGFDTAGKLVLASKVEPDSLLDVSGFGPKSLEKIAEFAEELPNLIPEPEPVAKVIEEQETQAEESEPTAEAVVEVAEPETSEEITAEAAEEEEVKAEAVEVEVEAEAEEGAEKSSSEELSFEEMFSIKTETFEPEEVVAEEEDEDVDDEGKPSEKKKKKQKVKRFRELEYDPDLDRVVAKKKHKRGDSSWNEWEH